MNNIFDDIFEENYDCYNNHSFTSYNIYDSPMNCNNKQIFGNIFIDDEISMKEDNIPAISEKTETKTQNLEEKSTNIGTFQALKFYSFEEIKKPLSEIWANNQIEEILNDGKCLENSAEYRFMNTLDKKRKRVEENDYINYSFDELQKKDGEKKRGRPPKKDSRKIHNKMASDNIILKIKAKLFEYILEFINSLLRNMKLNIELIQLDYNYIKNLSRDNELNLLNTTLKDILSMDISPKFKSKDIDYNKKTINDLINSKDKTKISNYNTLLFVLNMTFREWLDIFTGKNNFKSNQMNIDFDLIKNSFVGIDKFLSYLEDLKKKQKENDYKYVAFCIFYLYNYERWFFIKSSRKRKDKEEEIK